MDRVAERKDRDSGPALPPGLSGLGLGLGSNGKPLADVASKLGEDFSVFIYRHGYIAMLRMHC